MVFWRVHALYLSADKSYRCLFLSVVSDDGKSAHTSLIPECAASHVTSVLAIRVMYSAWNPKDNYDMRASLSVAQFNGFMSLKVSLMLSTDTNITETTYSCQF